MKISIPKHSELQIPMFLAKVPAGFPSPADEYLGDLLDLNEYMIKRKASTYFVNVEGDSMIGAGIFDGDIVIVDRSIKPKHGHIVIAVINNEFTIKRLSTLGGISLIPENDDYKPIELKGENELLIWGIVTGMVRKF